MKRYFTILNIAIITMAVYWGVKVSYQLIMTSLGPIARSKTIAMGDVSSENESFHTLSFYNVITQRNLFRTKIKTEKKIKPLNIEPLKQTDLKLKLWGTVTGENETPYAVIEAQNEKKQNLYRAGDSIQNATVKKILEKRVILNVDGHSEILEMEKIRSAKKQIKPPVKIQNPSDHNITVARSQIDNAIQNINALMRQAKIRPHFLNGKPDGLFISNIQHGSIFARLGLRNGDILTGVNGKSIQSVDDALKLYQDLKLSSNVAVQIKRKGKVLSIGYHIE
ncbi:MAG: type II secretion system protein GspC [Desulfobacterales bacterium]|nr:type II secretion system protein GspC [Desulfobacterales bacterium]MDP6808831.1 type II secretion system protein GspC [Desulfobacterales bacterium]|tara:strand:+ start:11675 stop:12514 length:840 start_codon:yes stop_codon:yes gene_type:complete